MYEDRPTEVILMTRQEFAQKLQQQSQYVPLEILKETLDFMNDLIEKHKHLKTDDRDSWKQDFASISQWEHAEAEVSIKTWKIESF